jgi:ElaB/YqjD/DUF883 family membrane-anchored ribosome-binding protein
MRSDQDIKRELDTAQADLECQVAAVRHVVDDVVARSRHVVELVRKPIDVVHAHPFAAATCALVLGALAGAIRADQ